MAVTVGVKPRKWTWRRHGARHGPTPVDPVMVLPGWSVPVTLLADRRTAGPGDTDAIIDPTIGVWGPELHHSVASRLNMHLGRRQPLDGLSAITVAALIAFDGTPATTFLTILEYDRAGGSTCFKLMTGTTATHLFGELGISGTTRQVSGDATYTIVSGTYFWAVLRWASGSVVSVDAFNVDGVKQAGGAVSSSSFSGTLTADDPGQGLCIGVKSWLSVGYVFPKSLTDAEMLLVAKYPWAWTRPRPPVLSGSLPITGGFGGPAAFILLGGGPHQ